MPREIIDELEKLIASSELQRRDLERLVQSLKELRDRAAHADQVGEPIEIAESKTHYERVVEFFVQQENRPHSMRAIVSATGIPAGSLSQVFYRTHAASFERSATPGHVRKKLWQLTDAIFRAGCVGQLNLFGEPVKDMAGASAKECCLQILFERNNLPTSALTLAREAIRRGYTGGATGLEDEVLMTTAKSFWARLCRDERFMEVRPQVFVLRGPHDEPAPLKPPGTEE